MPLLLLLAALVSAADPKADADAAYLKRNEAGAIETSLAALEAATKEKPGEAALLWRLGRAQTAAAGKLKGKEETLAALGEGGKTLRRAIEADPKSAEARYWLAWQLGRENALRRTLKLAKEMKAELESALELRPKYADALQLHCQLLRQLPGIFGGDKKKAVLECEEALRLSPNDTGRYVALAEAYAALKRRDEARAVLEKLDSVKKADDPAGEAADRAAARALLQSLKP